MDIKKWIGCFIVIALSACILVPVFHSGFYSMHDDAQVARVIVMGNALREGQFPVRWVSDLGYGYGYPLYNFYAPLSYYAGGGLKAIGVDSLIATKIMIGIGVCIGALSMYVLGYHVFGFFGGVLGSALFIFFPYRAIQLYVRGSIGELWAASFFPMILLSLIYFFERRPKRGMFIGIIGFAGTMLSHTIFGYIVSGFLLLILFGSLILSFLKKISFRFSLWVFLMIIMSIGISAFFILPAFFEMPFTNVSSVIGTTADFRNHFVCPMQLWSSQWGFGGSAPGCIDGMSFVIGKLHILFFVMALCIFLWRRDTYKKTPVMMFFLCAVVFFGASLAATLEITKPLWEIIPFSAFIQYPWRFLAFSGIFLSFASGILLYRVRKTSAIVFLSVIIISLFLFNRKFFVPQYTYEKPTSFFESKDELRYRASKVSDEYLPKEIQKPKDATEIIQSRVIGNEFLLVEAKEERDTSGSYMLQSTKGQSLVLSMAYFPGWHFFLDGKEVGFQVVGGRPVVVLSEGNIALTMRFEDTPIRRVGNILSVLTVLSIVIFYGKKTFSYCCYSGIQRRRRA